MQLAMQIEVDMVVGDSAAYEWFRDGWNADSHRLNDTRIDLRNNAAVEGLSG